MKRRLTVLVIMLIFYNVINETQATESIVIKDKKKTIKKTALIEFVYYDEEVQCFPQIEQIINNELLKACDFYQHRINRVVPVRLKSNAIISRNFLFTGKPENTITIPFAFTNKEMKFLCAYQSARVVLYDFLSTGDFSRTDTLHKLSNVPPWICEGTALFVAMGEDPRYWRSIYNLLVDEKSQGELFEHSPKGFVMYKTGQNFCSYFEDRYGAGKTAELIKELKDNKSFSKAIIRVTGNPYSAVLTEFKTYAKKKSESDCPLELDILGPAQNTEGVARLPLMFNKKTREFVYIEHNLNTAFMVKASNSIKSNNKRIKIKDTVIYSDLSEIRKNADISQDGKITAIIRKSKDGDSILIMDSDTGRLLQKKNMPFREITDISLSENGDTIAFIGINCWSFDVYTYQWKLMELKRITSDKHLKRYPVFCYNDSKIMFSKKFHNATQENNYCIYLVDLTTGNNDFYFDTGGNDIQPDVAHDGSRFVFVSDHTGKYEIYEYYFKNNKLLRISSSLNSSFMPHYTQDEKGLVAVILNNGYYNICQYTFNNKNEQ